jgi:hypothetical protein
VHQLSWFTEEHARFFIENIGDLRSFDNFDPELWSLSASNFVQKSQAYRAQMVEKARKSTVTILNTGMRVLGRSVHLTVLTYARI